MDPGDLLYIPRGWAHQAEAVETNHSLNHTPPPAVSLHITVGVEVDEDCTWGAVLHLVAETAAASLRKK